MTKLCTKMIELMERERYAKSTIRNYVGIVAQFAQFHGKCASTLGEEHVAQYLDHLCRRGVSISLLNITHSALRWFYTRVLDRNWNNRLFHKACQKAGIRKAVTPHGLRHSRVGGPICNTLIGRGCRYLDH